MQPPRESTHAIALAFGQGLLSALQRGQALAASCFSMGPFYSLIHDEDVSSEFVNVTIDLAQALSKVGLVK